MSERTWHRAATMRLGGSGIADGSGAPPWRRAAATLLAGCLAAALAACGMRPTATPPTPATPSPAAAPVAAPPPLRVGSSGDYPPFSTRTADGDWEGFDVAVARAYARDRDRQLELVPFRWPELGARLAAGEFDVAMSGITVRPERLVIGTMTAAVAHADAVLVRNAGSAPAAPKARPRVAVNRGGHLERLARATLPHVRLVPVDDNRTLPTLLRTGSVDAIVTDTLELATFAPAPSTGEDAPFAILARLGHDRKAYWVAPAAAELAADLDAWLLTRERDGTLSKLRTRYLGTPDATPVALAPATARVVDLLARRLLLMPLVGAAKAAAGRSVEDTSREAAVAAAGERRAREAGLDPATYLGLLRAEIAAAKMVQHAATTERRSGRTSSAAAAEDPRAAEAPAPAAESAPTIEAVRAAIDRLDTAIVGALVTAAPIEAAVPDLAEALESAAPLAGLDQTRREALARALRAVRVASGTLDEEESSAGDRRAGEAAAVGTTP